MRFAIFFLFATLTAHAQNRYTLQGFYSEPGKIGPVPYALNWVENGDEIKGLYKDSSLKESIPLKVMQNGKTRILQIDTRGLTLITQIPETAEKKVVPVSLTQMDKDNNILAANIVQADLSVDLPQAQQAPQTEQPRQAQEAQPCHEGFGDLAGYCGLYQGMVEEEQDTGNRCTLSSAGSPPRLELTEAGELGVRVAAVSTINPNPVHVVGRIPLNTSKTSVDVMSRVCRPLDGTSFGGDNCKRINITGDFSSSVTNDAHFFGTYTIVDEKTNERCQYKFSLNRS